MNYGLRLNISFTNLPKVCSYLTLQQCLATEVMSVYKMSSCACMNVCVKFMSETSVRFISLALYAW